MGSGTDQLGCVPRRHFHRSPQLSRTHVRDGGRASRYVIPLIGYAFLEHRIDRAGATRQSAALVVVIVAALAVTSLITAIAILAILAGLFSTIGELGE